MPSTPTISPRDDSLEEPLIDNDLQQAEEQTLVDDQPLLSSDDQETTTSMVASNENWSVATELASLMPLAFGIVVARLSWVVIKFTDSALLGHVSAHALAASAYADLWMSATGVFTMGGVLGVFVGQAVGAGNKELAAVWLQVSTVVVLAITIPVMVSWALTGDVVRALGVVNSKNETEIPSLEDDAGYFGMVLALCLPARTIFGQISQYFSANRVVQPEAFMSAFASILNLVLGLVFVLGIPINGFDGFKFRACPWVTTATEWSQLICFLVIYCWIQGYHTKLGWVGFQWHEITRARVTEFLKMYIPMALSSASDWWRLSVLGVFAGGIGEVELDVFNTSYRILWLTLTVVGAFAFAVRVRLSMALGAGNVVASKRTVAVGVGCAALALVVCTLGVYLGINQLAHIFTDDPRIVGLFEDSVVPLCLVLFSMNFSVFLEQIPVAMGKTRAVFMIGVMGSWLGQVPCGYLFIHYIDNTIQMLYYGVAVGYGFLCLLLLAVIARSDWHAVAQDAQRRSEM